MGYKLAGKLAVALCTCGWALCVASVPLASLFPQPGLAGGLVLAAAAVLLLGAVFLWLAFYRCPHWGRLLPLRRDSGPGLCHQCGEKLP